MKKIKLLYFLIILGVSCEKQETETTKKQKPVAVFKTATTEKNLNIEKISNSSLVSYHLWDTGGNSIFIELSNSITVGGFLDGVAHISSTPWTQKDSVPGYISLYGTLKKTNGQQTFVNLFFPM